MPDLDPDELEALIDISKKLLIEGFRENDEAKIFAGSVGFNSLSFYLSYVEN